MAPRTLVDFMTPPTDSSDTSTHGQRRFVLFGLFGTGNIGNDATLRVTLHYLRTREPDADIICVCNELPEFARDFGVSPLPLNPLPVRGRWRIANAWLRNAYAATAMLVSEPLRRARMRRVLAGADSLIFVGTGVFDDFGLLPWDMPAWMLGWCRAAVSVGAQVQLLAVGAGPMRNRLNRALMKRAIVAADRRSLRDTVSRDYLQSIGVDTSADSVVPDLVFGLPSEWIAHSRPPESPPRVVGLGVMGYFGWNADQQKGQGIYRTYITKMEQFLRWLLERGYAVRLLVGELPTDERPVRDLLSAVDPHGQARSEGSLATQAVHSLDGLLKEIAATDIVVASRFHNVICALAAGRPAMAVGYASKFDALMAEMGMGSYSLHIETFEVEQLKRDFVTLAESHAEVKARLGSRCATYRQSVQQVFAAHFHSSADPQLRQTATEG